MKHQRASEASNTMFFVLDLMVSRAGDIVASHRFQSLIFLSIFSTETNRVFRSVYCHFKRSAVLKKLKFIIFFLLHMSLTNLITNVLFNCWLQKKK